MLCAAVSLAALTPEKVIYRFAQDVSSKNSLLKIQKCGWLKVAGVIHLSMIN